MYNLSDPDIGIKMMKCMYYARKAVINDSFPGIFVSGKTLVLSFFLGESLSGFWDFYHITRKGVPHCPVPLWC